MATRGESDQGSEALMTGSAGRLRCGVCLELYRQPKLLPCFHTFCTPCLKRLAAPHKGDTTLGGTSRALKDIASTESPNTDSAGKDNSSFPCPTCREVVFPPPGGVEVFQRNFKMEAALAYAQVQPLACEMCDNSSPSVIACVECQKRLCAPCQRFHDQVAGTKYHNLISMETSGHQATGGKADGRQATGLHKRAAHKTFCKTHCKQERVFHCCPCDVLICPLCRETSHQGHDTEDLYVASERIRAHVRDLLEQLDIKVKVVTEVISEVSRTEQDLERQRQAVVSEAVEAAGKVSAWANQAEDNVVKEVNKMADPVKNELRKRKTAAREVNATLVLLQDRTKHVMKTGSYAELLSLRSDLERSLDSDVTQSLEKSEGQLNPFVFADTDTVNSNVNSTRVSMPKGVKTMDTVFFKRRSSGQEILQNTVPRYVGDVRSGQAEYAAKTTAFTVQPLQQCFAFCVDLNGDGFSVLEHPVNRMFYAGFNQRVHWSQSAPSRIHKYTLRGQLFGNFTFSDYVSEGDSLMQPWPEGWLIIWASQKRLQLINGTGQYRNEETGKLTGASVSFAGVLSNSSSNGHVYAIHNGGSGCVWEIQEISLDPKGNISVKPFFQVLLQDTLNQFDVSADEEYFATMKSSDVILKVNVYRRQEAQPCASFTTGCGETNTGRIHEKAFLCFSRYKGQTMLRLSVLGQNCVYVLDHKKGCTVVHKMTIDRPVFLRRDCRERVWMGLQNKSIVVFET